MFHEKGVQASENRDTGKTISTAIGFRIVEFGYSNSENGDRRCVIR